MCHLKIEIETIFCLLLPPFNPILKRGTLRHSLLFIKESDSTLNEAIVSALVKKGFKVATYSDHHEALSVLNELKLELIILGERPLVDNLEACSQLRQAINIPILILGTVPGNIAWVKAVAAGADFYLVKPFHYSELVARVKAILRRRQWSLEEVKRNG